MNQYKQALAQIIHDKGGWVSVGGYAAQDKDDSTIWFSIEKPTRRKGQNYWVGGKRDGIACDRVLSNWFCVVLSRNEYFHLYPAPVKVVVENKTTCHLTVTDKPTIEQLAADYRNLKDYADRKQQEADAKLVELVAAGKALGLVLSVTDTGPELVITDWRDLRVGDRIWVGYSGHSRNCPEGEYEIAAIDSRDSDQPVGLAWPGGRSGVTWPQIHKRGWRFISRPAKGGADA